MSTGDGGAAKLGNTNYQDVTTVVSSNCMSEQKTRRGIKYILITIMSKKWCFTRYEPDQKTTFHWKIDNFNKRMEEESNASFLYSDTFNIGRESFNLKLVINSESSGFVG